jgi:RecA-family ATPase
MSDLTIATAAHDREMARDFLACLDPNAGKFTFQLFGDGDDRYAEIFHGTLDELWPKVQTLNTLHRRVGVFVTVNETDFKGRRRENIVRVRALFADADSDEQVRSCEAALTACGITPSIVVKTGRGVHYYFLTALPLDQFRDSQEKLIDRLGTDPSIKDFPRVMRLPGTLHLKTPGRPKLVELVKTTTPVLRWEASELVAKLGSPASIPATPSATANAAPFSPMTPAHVSPGTLAPNPGQGNVLPNLTAADRERVQRLFGPLTGCLSDGIFTNIEEIRSAVSAIPPSAISIEPDWVKFARALAHEAAARKSRAEQLWDMLDTASRRAPGYNETDNRSRWLRYISEAFARDKPITIASVFDLARKHGWPGWAPAAADYRDANAMSATASALQASAELKVSFSNIPHRQWLYGVDLVRKDITLLASPGGAGKTSLALGMATCLATGKAVLGEKIWGSDHKSLYINAEDNRVEMLRRACAFCQQHGISEQELGRLDLVGADDPRVQGISFLRAAGPTSSVLDQAGFVQLESLLISLRPDLIVLDPLIALCGGGNVNDNAVMSLVMRELKKLAMKYNCAILIVLHTNKGGDLTRADAISGASAIVNLSRHAVMPVTMSEAEAKTFGLLPSERRQYFKLVDAKSNLAPLSGEKWYKLENQELTNPELPTYPHGDRVQAVVRANLTPSKASSAADPERQTIRFEILKLIERGLMIDGKTVPYSPNSTGKNKMRAILEDVIAAVKRVSGDREYSPTDLRAVAERELEAVKHDGWVVVEEIAKGRFRRTQGLRPVWERTPWAKERAALHQHGGPTVRTEDEEQELHRRDLEEALREDADRGDAAGGEWVNDGVND